MKRVAMLAAASAFSALSLAALTACGSGTESDGTTGEPRPSATETKPPTPAERLHGLMVTSADVDGYRVEPHSDAYRFAESPEDVTLDKQVCAPLAHAVNQLPLGDPQAHLVRVLSKDAGAHTYVTLATYTAGGAGTAMDDLKKAVASCGDGFTAKASGGTSTYDSVTAEKVAPAGDDSLGFTTTMTFRGASHTHHTQVVRSGDVIGVYFAVDGRAIAETRPSDAKLPVTVVKAQNAKLK
ncbi:hypothetical protein ACWDY7_29375 [Streptomyces calvus]|uniref:Lipoprotein n=1 Tax=Streptomyces calvus TaxID=67282 RepID=A0A514JSN4_9ACTN|nr:hypothetical protein [Streptomyces calvus]MBA8947790.1 hypothetical protein [Streptomyces calvus]QDI70364.1 hypothetical protein CD934_17915 [Streptomyces calvus]GGP80292.1 hypothetical protein GCM10010247_62030 [Streptomyces calvus]